MSTRSEIGIIYMDESIRSVYCHNNGDPDGVGLTLLQHWAQGGQEAVDILLNGGDMSSLGKDSIDTIYYGRDRGEQDTDAKVRSNLKSFDKMFMYDVHMEWCYLYDVRHDQWRFRPHAFGASGNKLKRAVRWQSLTTEAIEEYTKKRNG